MSELPVFTPITPDRIDALYQELFKPYDDANTATKWSVRRQALDILEREQERVTRMYEARYRSGDSSSTEDHDAERKIEAARNLLLQLHIERLSGVFSPSEAVQALMTELDNAIFAWDSSQSPQDESRWRPYRPDLTAQPDAAPGTSDDAPTWEEWRR
jgi:hypothetical protein